MPVRIVQHLPRDVAPKRVYRYAGGPAVRVADTMTWPAITVDAAASMEEARKVAAEAWVHYLPVLDGQRYIGLTCVCDLRRITRVGTLGPSTATSDAARLMMKIGRDGLPVTVRERVLGFLTMGDLVRAGAIEAEDRPRCPSCGSRRHLRHDPRGVVFCDECVASSAPTTGDAYDELGGGD